MSPSRLLDFYPTVTTPLKLATAILLVGASLTANVSALDSTSS